jgi:hypothetical protein
LSSNAAARHAEWRDTHEVRPKLLCEVTLDERHGPTRNTLHIVGGQAMAPPAALHIVRYDNDPGFYLLYLDVAGEEMTDTWHQTLDDAMHQAEFEFSVAASEWRTITEPR